MDVLDEVVCAPATCTHRRETSRGLVICGRTGRVFGPVVFQDKYGGPGANTGTAAEDDGGDGEAAEALETPPCLSPASRTSSESSDVVQSHASAQRDAKLHGEFMDLVLRLVRRPGAEEAELAVHVRAYAHELVRLRGVYVTSCSTVAFGLAFLFMMRDGWRVGKAHLARPDAFLTDRLPTLSNIEKLHLSRKDFANGNNHLTQFVDDLPRPIDAARFAVRDHADVMRELARAQQADSAVFKRRKVVYNPDA